MKDPFTKAVESLNKIVPRMSLKQIEEYYVPLIKRLGSGDWFTSRTSATGLFASCYPFASPVTQEELRR
jgi:serine/threonine-protein phosphatase 2A regulatory subunit A